jgi:hypothetical protein
MESAGLDAETMHALRSQIRGCPEPLVVTEADHFCARVGRAGWTSRIALLR